MLAKHGKMPRLTKFDNNEFYKLVILSETQQWNENCCLNNKKEICLIRCYY